MRLSLFLSATVLFQLALPSAAQSSFCTPTAEQLANRASTGPLPPETPLALPEPGGKYCDPAFGTEVLRLSDDTSDKITTDTLGQVGFNQDSTRFATRTGEGQIRVYLLNPQSLTVEGPGVTIGYPIERANGQGDPIGCNSAVWSQFDDEEAPATLLCTFGMTLYAVHTDHKTAEPLADLNSLFDTPAESNPLRLGTLQLIRCSGSHNTRVIGCTILLRTPAEEYPRIGYVVFELHAGRTTDAKTNWTLKAKFINGVDSPSISDYQTVRLESIDYTLVSRFEPGGERGGYKPVLDRSGRYLIFLLTDPPVAEKYNSMLILDLEKVPAKEDQPFSILQAGGHGDVGAGVYVGMTTAGGSCPTCMKRWQLPTLTSEDDPAANNGDEISPALGWDFYKQYNSMLAAPQTETSIVLTCPVGGCPVHVPYLGELFNLKVDGSQATTRLALLGHVSGTGYEELQPMQSPDGKLIAFSSNFGSRLGRVHTFIVRVP